MKDAARHLNAAFIMSMSEELKCLACNINALGMIHSLTPGTSELHLLTLAFSPRSRLPKAALQILAKAHTLHLIDPLGMYTCLFANTRTLQSLPSDLLYESSVEGQERELVLRGVRRVVTPFRPKMYLEDECRLLKRLCPNVEEVCLLPSAQPLG